MHTICLQYRTIPIIYLIQHYNTNCNAYIYINIMGILSSHSSL